MDTDPSLRDLCTLTLADPQPAPGDPTWHGHAPGSGRVVVRACPLSKSRTITELIWLPNGTPLSTASPAALAQRAVQWLELPRPTFERSPSPGGQAGSVPFTWVNLWTWYWTSPALWRVAWQTAHAGPVWATARATPVTLMFDPGDGSPAVSCSGPGRPWRESDADDPPSAGGCGYLYRHVTSRGPITTTLSIHWAITWTGSGGTSGSLPGMTTQTSSPLLVQQIQAVNR